MPACLLLDTATVLIVLMPKLLPWDSFLLKWYVSFAFPVLICLKGKVNPISIFVYPCNYFSSFYISVPGLIRNWTLESACIQCSLIVCVLSHFSCVCNRMGILQASKLESGYHSLLRDLPDKGLNQHLLCLLYVLWQVGYLLCHLGSSIILTASIPTLVYN